MNHHGRCSMFEKYVPAVEGDACSECGCLLMHASGLTWADARAKEATAEYDRVTREAMANRHVLLAATVSQEQDLIAMPVGEFQVRHRTVGTTTTIRHRYLVLPEGYVEVWEFGGDKAMVTGSIRRMPASQDDLLAAEAIERGVQVNIDGVRC